MSAASAAVVASSSASSAALAAVNSARVTACKSLIQSFDSSRPAVTEMQDYAECVNLVYPQTTGEFDTTGMKVLFVLALVGLVGGVVKAIRCHGWREMTPIACFGIIGGIGLPMLALLAVGIACGVRWLFA